MARFHTSRFGSRARLLATATFGIIAVSSLALADPESDPVVATVNKAPIHLSDLKAAAEMLPAQARQMPPQQLYPVLLNQLVDAQALADQAHKEGLDKDSNIARVMHLASERALVSAMLNKVIQPQITDQAIKAKYDKDIASKPGEQEVHARHILVPDEATAKKVIAELQKGGDFAALSKQYSKDPGAAKQGGDLGWFKKTDMVPAFADAAFALKDGEVTPTPVQTQFGWHVIQTLGHRTASPPPFDEARDELRQQMAQAAIQKAIDHAREGVPIQTFNLDGSPTKPTETGVPAGAAPAPASAAPAAPATDKH